MENKQKNLIWITAILEVLFFAVAVFGWANFESILQKEDFFSSTCNVTITVKNETTCTSQINSLFTITASVSPFTNILEGKLLDKYGRQNSSDEPGCCILVNRGVHTNQCVTFALLLLPTIFQCVFWAVHSNYSSCQLVS